MTDALAPDDDATTVLSGVAHLKQPPRLGAAINAPTDEPDGMEPAPETDPGATKHVLPGPAQWSHIQEILSWVDTRAQAASNVYRLWLGEMLGRRRWFHDPDFAAGSRSSGR